MLLSSSRISPIGFLHKRMDIPIGIAELCADAAPWLRGWCLSELYPTGEQFAIGRLHVAGAKYDTGEPAPRRSILRRKVGLSEKDFYL